RITWARPACAIASASAGCFWLMWSFAATRRASASKPGLYSTTDSAAASEPVPVTLLPIWNPKPASFVAVSRARFGVVVPFTTVTVTLEGLIAGGEELLPPPLFAACLPPPLPDDELAAPEP